MAVKNDWNPLSSNVYKRTLVSVSVGAVLGMALMGLLAFLFIHCRDRTNRYRSRRIPHNTLQRSHTFNQANSMPKPNLLEYSMNRGFRIVQREQQAIYNPVQSDVTSSLVYSSDPRYNPLPKQTAITSDISNDFTTDAYSRIEDIDFSDK